MVAFCEEFLSENDFEAVLVNICCEAVQKISARALLELCQLTKTVNFIASYTYEKSLLAAC